MWKICEKLYRNTVYLTCNISLVHKACVFWLAVVFTFKVSMTLWHILFSAFSFKRYQMLMLLTWSCNRGGSLEKNDLRPNNYEKLFKSIPAVDDKSKQSSSVKEKRTGTTEDNVRIVGMWNTQWQLHLNLKTKEHCRNMPHLISAAIFHLHFVV